MQGLVLALLGDEGPRIPQVPGLGLVSQALHHLHTTQHHSLAFVLRCHTALLLAFVLRVPGLGLVSQTLHHLHATQYHCQKKMALCFEIKFSLRQNSSHSRVTHLSAALMPDAFFIVAAHIALGDYAHGMSCLWLCLHVLMCSSCRPAFSRPHLFHAQCNKVDDTHPDSLTQTFYLRAATFGFGAPSQTASRHGRHQNYKSVRVLKRGLQMLPGWFGCTACRPATQNHELICSSAINIAASALGLLAQCTMQAAMGVQYRIIIAVVSARFLQALYCRRNCTALPVRWFQKRNT